MILNHEPFEDGISFDSFLESYNHKFLIVNMKCDGGEELIMHNDKIYVIFEGIGGKVNWMFYKDGYGNSGSGV